MKNIVLITLFVIGFTSFSMGQLRKMSEGYFQYYVEVKALTNNPDVKAAVTTMQGSTIEMYFNPTKVRVDFKMDSESYTTIVVDKQKKVRLTLMDIMGRKMAYVDEDFVSNNTLAAPKGLKKTNETKTILGFQCTKYLLNDSGVTGEFWLTTQIEINLEDLDIIQFDLPGFPLEFTNNDGEVEMKYTVSNIEYKLKKPENQLFNVTIPVGYERVK